MKELEAELMRRLSPEADGIESELGRILCAGPSESLVDAATRQMRELRACREELDVDGCAKWENERREIVKVLDEVGAPTKADSTRVFTP